MPFQKGKSGNPGGRPAHQTKYLKSLVRLVKSDDWKAVIVKAIEQAKRGDKAARDFLADYCLGKPVQPVDANVDAIVRFLVEYDDGLHNNPPKTP
jgi:hypothetical protein